MYIYIPQSTQSISFDSAAFILTPLPFQDFQCNHMITRNIPYISYILYILYISYLTFEVEVPPAPPEPVHAPPRQSGPPAAFARPVTQVASHVQHAQHAPVVQPVMQSVRLPPPPPPAPPPVPSPMPPVRKPKTRGFRVILKISKYTIIIYNDI